MKTVTRYVTLRVSYRTALVISAIAFEAPVWRNHLCSDVSAIRFSFRDPAEKKFVEKIDDLGRNFIVFFVAIN